jgi:hypothetical protein
VQTDQHTVITSNQRQYPAIIAYQMTPSPRDWPLPLSYAFMRRFHHAAARTMVATAGQQRLLEHWRFTNIVRWSRGVDTGLFTPEEPAELEVKRPLFIYTGRGIPGDRSDRCGDTWRDRHP